MGKRGRPRYADLDPFVQKIKLAEDLLAPVRYVMARRLTMIMEYTVSLFPTHCPHCGKAIELRPEEKR